MDAGESGEECGELGVAAGEDGADRARPHGYIITFVGLMVPTATPGREGRMRKGIREVGEYS
ncbi:hypothetical protein Ssi02_51740 [Sinosporangium siamense]|uniref:Uncharacterized protein n=1 Tax=Sinosporangium siamense TaxID=1367973 RepID=A0A919RJT3_9ACTN|nr:hypothetical protein Ssi02_51740 [Sinosporangium siamense]